MTNLENFVININKQSYINLNPVEIIFKNRSFKIIFNDNFESFDNQIENSDNIFENIFDSTTKVDTAFLLENSKSEKDGFTIIKLKNMCLFQNTLLSDLINLIATILQAKVSDLELDLSSLNIVSNVPFQSYSPVLCVGTSSLKFISQNNYYEDYGFYIDNVVEWYVKQCNYIDKMIKKTEITSYTFDYNIFKISIAFRTKRYVDVNLVRIFNNINTSKRFSRLIIHDDLLDTYNNVNHVQYVKNQNVFDMTNKHVIPKINILSLYTQSKMADGIVLECIDVFKDGSFKYNFYISKNMTLKEIIELTDLYFENNLEKDFSDLLINECSLTNSTEQISINDYHKIISNLSSVYMLENASPDTIKLIDQIFIFKNIESRFRSNTSVNINSYNFFNENTIHQLNEDYKNHSIITENNVRINIMPELLFAYVDNLGAKSKIKSSGNINIQCNRFTDFDEIKFGLAFIIPLLKINVKDVKTTGDPVEDILERLRNQSVKQNLKRLSSEDPELFAPRTVSKNPRAYSALCQIKEQRPSIITESEYHLIHAKYHDSTFNIANQSNDKQRLYMVCPYEGFRFANYHHFNNQKCIVRCTTKMSNPGQYTQCAIDLDAEYISGTKLTHQSAAIVKYNENLAVNRKCYLPKELTNILPNIVCVRVDVICRPDELISVLRRFYKALPLIIRRNSELNRYEFLTEYDFNSDMDYILILEPESKPKYKYICVDIETNMPFYISKSKTFSEFLKKIYKINKTFDIIVEFIKRLIVHEDYEEISTIKYFENLALKRNIKLVINNEILVGLIKNKKFYSIPQIPWPIKSADICIKSDTVLKNIQDGIFMLPDFSEFKQYIKNEEIICENFEDGRKITGLYVNILNSDIIMCCKHENISENMNIDKIKFLDSMSWLKFTLSENKPIEIRLIDFLSIDKQFEQIISLLLQRFIKIYPEPWKYDNIKNKFIEFIEQITGGFKDKTEIIYIRNLISIFQTKFNKSDLEKYLEQSSFSFKMSNISNIIYKTAIEEFELPHLPNEIITQKQFS